MPDPSTPKSDASLRAGWAREVRARLASVPLSPTRENEVVEELSQHLEDRWRELVSAGVPEDEATESALAEFREGNLLARYMTPLRQAHQPPRITTGGPTSGHLLDDLWQDLRYAFRQLRNSPVFAAVAILTLGLGIGINTATFTWLRATLFARLPVDAPERVTVIWSVSPTRGITRSATSVADLEDWRLATTSFEELTAALPASYNLAGAGTPERVAAMRATAGFFRLLGATAAEGRLFGLDEETPGVSRVAVLSRRFWTNRFGSDRGIIGRDITLDGEPYTVVGVASDAVSLLPVDLWTPLTTEEARGDRSRRDLLVIGRFESDTTIEVARAELAGVAARLARDYPETNAGWTVAVVPLLDAFLGPDAKVLFSVFTGAVVFILLIGCANIANLLLARGLSRTQEIAVRIALGARRGRLIRQFLTESVVLAGLGGLVGLFIAVLANDLLRSTVLGATPFAERVRIDAPTLLFMAVVSMAAALVFGTAPAVQASALRLQDMKAGSGISARLASVSMRQLFVAGEIALAAALLIVAGVFIRTGIAVLNADPGFDADNVLTARLSLPATGYANPERAAAFYEEAIARISRLPGVLEAAATTRLPLAGGVLNANRTVEIEGRPATARDGPWAFDLIVTPAFFRTLRIPLSSGRAFAEGDARGAPPVAIVSDTFASRYLGDSREAIGKRIRLGMDGSPWLDVVAVAADVRNDDLGAPPAPQVYLPHAQNSVREMSLLVRTVGEPLAIRYALEDVVRSLDSALPLYQVRTMEQVVMSDVADVPLIMGILTVCSALALLLASLGIYGVIAYSVRQQTREIAIRIALGAKAREVVSLVISRTAIWASLGLAVGLSVALALAQVIAHNVDFVEGIDWLTLTAALAALTLVTVTASWLPARHAARVDPMMTLRAE
ncbi:MAG: ADOP family duplicated permease [Acidobacteriota bacterium]